MTDSPEKQLAAHRARIDALDDEIIARIHERTETVKQVATLKNQHWKSDCHIRPGREGRMHARIAGLFAKEDFSARAALAIWRQMIGASTHIESPLTIATLSSHPSHHWLAREYFGVQVHPLVSKSVADMLACMAEKKCNLLVLPKPTVLADWWATLPQTAPNLRIFATLPLVEDTLPPGVQPALALAAITPEDSGDDISYFLLTGDTPLTEAPIEGARMHTLGNKTLLIVDGFHTVDSPAIAALKTHFHSIDWLGAHPRPLQPA